MRNASSILHVHASGGLTKVSLYAAASVAAVLSATPAWADSGAIETVVVTAEKRSENIQNVPIAISAISGDQIESLGITDIQSLAPMLPNFGINTSQNNRNAGVSIRNFSSGGANPGIEGEVGVYIDGLYQPAGGGTSLASLIDIADVEVLRGPQGTLYGRNTVAGALVVNTRAPSQTQEAMVSVTLGNYGYNRYQGYYSGGITDNLAGRLVLFGDGGNDWAHDITTGQWVHGQTEFGGRSRLTYTPTTNLTVNVIGSYDHINSTCCDWQIAQYSLSGPYSVLTPNFLASQAAEGTPFVAPNYKDHEVISQLTPANETIVAETEVRADYTLPFGATLTSISGYNVYIGIETVQPGGYFANNEGIQYQNLNMTSYSEEFRLASETGGFIEYLAGLYAYYQDTTYLNHFIFGPGANLLTAGGAPKNPVGTGSGFFSGQETRSGALFGQVKINPFENFHIIGGIRYSYTEKQGVQDTYTIGPTPTNATTGNMRYSRGVVTWLGTAQYNLNDDVMFYASASTGFKDGGFNLANAANAPPFNPEQAFNYEIGAKATLFDNKVVLDVDIYDMKIKGYQQSVWNGALTPPHFVVGNAGNLQSRGYEATLNARPIDPLSLLGTISLADEEISGYAGGSCSSFPGTLITPRNTGPAGSPTPTGTCDYDGLAPAFAPRMRWSIQAQWEQPLHMFSGWDWFIEGDFNWTGSDYLDPTLDPPSYQGPVKLLNARFGVESESGTWRIMAWGKNLTDTLYYTAMTNLVTGAYMQGATPTTPPVGGYSDIYAPPRTFGVQASYRF